MSDHKVVKLTFSGYTPGSMVMQLHGTGLELYEQWLQTDDEDDYLELMNWLLEDFEVVGRIIECVNIDDVEPYS